MNDRKTEIQRSVSMPGYLDKLEHPMGFRPNIEDMTSSHFACQMRNELNNNLKLAPIAKMTVPFTEKLSKRFSTLIVALEYRNPHPVFVWMDAANECGYAKPIKLSHFKFGFEFRRIPEGIISLITTDARDKMLVDFEMGDDGIESMIIELHGEEWGKADLEHFHQAKNYP